MDLIINKVQDIAYSDEFHYYFNNIFICSSITSKKDIITPPYQPYNKNFVLDLIDLYTQKYNVEINNILFYSVFVNVILHREPDKNYFSEYQSDEIETSEILFDGTLRELEEHFYSDSKNIKQYVLINRKGSYLTSEHKWSKNLKNALVDSYYNLEYLCLHIRRWNTYSECYDVYIAGIKKKCTMQILEEKYRSKSDSYFANVFNKRCSFKYLQCWNK